VSFPNRFLPQTSFADKGVVCSIVRVINKDDKKDFISDAFPIAGELKDQGGGYSDVKWTRLKTSKLNKDAGKEGVRLEIKGGFRTVDGAKKKQKAFVEFICDKSLVGDENLWDPEDKYEDGNTKREANANGEPSLQFVNYDKSDKDEDVLTLLWKTKYACEETKKEEDEERKSHWGFFTWFIIMYSPPPRHSTLQVWPANRFTARSYRLLHT
jgi:autophagy-related protein 27